MTPPAGWPDLPEPRTIVTQQSSARKAPVHAREGNLHLNI